MDKKSDIIAVELKNEILLIPRDKVLFVSVEKGDDENGMSCSVWLTSDTAFTFKEAAAEDFVNDYYGGL